MNFIPFIFFKSSAPAPIGPSTLEGSSFKKITAPTSGTKWHNEPGDKKWHEARSDEGYTYYWNTKTHGNKVMISLKNR